MTEDLHDVRSICTDLINAFAYYIDHHLFDRAVELFADDAVFDRPDGKREGKQAIAMLWENRPEASVTRHLFGAPFFVSISSANAESVTQCTVYQTTHEGDSVAKVAAPLGIAEYTDQFIRTESGWKFVNKKVVPVILQS
jgi:ketosteroid isomerase-like protein